MCTNYEEEEKNIIAAILAVVYQIVHIHPPLTQIHPITAVNLHDCSCDFCLHLRVR